MSIFKQSFPNFVKKQFETREKVLASGINPNTGESISGGRSKEFFAYSLSKQCTIRMASGVDLAEGVVIDGRTGKKLAQRYLLEGGIQWEDIDKKKGGLSKNIGGKFEGAYGSTDMRGDAQDGYGIVPMPGIIDAQIRTKSAYGSLREAKVKFVCHNKRQLEILELLYMRPGHTLLLEWQWTPFIGNDGTIDNKMYWVSTAQGTFFNGNDSYAIETEIIEAKKSSGGNYDALMGFCKNFSYTLRDDGGYNCETEIIAKGEVIESLKDMEEYRDKDGNKANAGTDQTGIESFITTLRYFYNPVVDGWRGNANNKKTMHEKNDIEARDTALDYLVGSDRTVTTEVDGRQLAENLITAADAPPWIITQNQFNIFDADSPDGSWVGHITPEDRQGTTFNTTHPYVRWDALAHALNKFIPKGAGGRPLFQFQTYVCFNEDSNPKIEPLRYAEPTAELILSNEPFNLTKPPTPKNKDADNKSIPTGNDNEILLNKFSTISTNPNICLLPHQLYEMSNYHQSAGFKGVYADRNKRHTPLVNNLINRVVGTGTSTTPAPDLTDTDHTYAIGAIYINTNFLRKKFKEMYYDGEGSINDDFSIYKFIEAIFEDISACTQTLDLKLNTDNRPEGDIIRVMDMSNVAEGDIDLNSIHELKIQSPDSCVRNLAYNTTIPSSLSATIAIAAQAPGSVDSLDKVSFAALNKNIVDRYNKESTDKNLDGQRKKWKQRFDEALEDISLALFLRDDPDNTIDGKLVDFGLDSFFSKNFKNTQRDDAKNTEANETLASMKSTLRKVQKAIAILQNSYVTDGAEDGVKYYRGQFANVTSPVSSVIPLKFNAKIDGISGIVIGSVFKLPKDKLPIGYQGDDVFFVVMGEEQTITSGQDWTTTISGHLILLGGSDQYSNAFKKSWRTKSIEYVSAYLNITGGEGTTGEEQRKALQDLTQGDQNVSSEEADKANTNAVGCGSLRSHNQALYNKFPGRKGNYANSNIPRTGPRHELPGGRDQCVTTTAIEFMDEFIKQFKSSFPDIPEALVIKIAAGFAGNVKHESSFGITIYGDGGNAVGLCQWNGTRFDRLVATGNWDTLEGQVSFIMQELPRRKDTLSVVQTPGITVEECALAIVNLYERPQSYVDAYHAGNRWGVGNPHVQWKNAGMDLTYPSARERAAAARKIYNDYAGDVADPSKEPDVDIIASYYNVPDKYTVTQFPIGYFLAVGSYTWNKTGIGSTDWKSAGKLYVRVKSATDSSPFDGGEFLPGNKFYQSGEIEYGPGEKGTPKNYRVKMTFDLGSFDKIRLYYSEKSITGRFTYETYMEKVSYDGELVGKNNVNRGQRAGSFGAVDPSP